MSNSMNGNNLSLNEFLNLLQRQSEAPAPQAAATTAARAATTTDLDARALEALLELNRHRNTNTRTPMMDASAFASSAIATGGRAGSGYQASSMTSSDWTTLIINAQERLRTTEQELQARVSFLQAQAQAQHEKQQLLLACLSITNGLSVGGGPGVARGAPTAAPRPEPRHVRPPRVPPTEATLQGQLQSLTRFLIHQEQQQRQPVQLQIEHNNVLQDQKPPQTTAFAAARPGAGSLADSSSLEAPSTTNILQSLGLHPPGIISSYDQTQTTTMSTNSQQQSVSNEVAEQGRNDHHDANTSPAQKGRVVKFPQTLHNILVSLEQGGCSDVAAFTPDGTGFVIYKPKEFIKDYFSKHFRASSFSSFQRQINLYCFQRIKCGTDNIYSHPKFRRNFPDTCLEMKRTKIKNARLVSARKDKNHC
jgi:HSF-type DNA-binding